MSLCAAHQRSSREASGHRDHADSAFHRRCLHRLAIRGQPGRRRSSRFTGLGRLYIQLNNLILIGDLSALTEYLQSNQGYIHVWGQVQELDGERQLLLSGWELFDEFSGYFDGTVRRTAGGDFLELSDGRLLRLPALPADVPADIPLYAQGGLVADTLEWFTLQVHLPSDWQTPPDLSQASASITQVELVFLAPDLGNLPPERALDPAYRMLLPAWLFSGRITTADGTD